MSVLFADMVGFTSLSEQRDSEDVRELLTRYFDTASEIVERYGGTVEKFIGDAVMAVWGTTATREDDAQRAVRAAMDLIEATESLGVESGSLELRLRAGVLTGEGTVTIGAQNQGMVAGDMVNTAARLQSAAEPGSVLVGDATYSAASRAIQFEDAGEHALKGKEKPVHAWRALRVVAGPAVPREEGLDPPFVGREEEFRLVKDMLHLTTRERTPRMLSIVGIGGIGKSRIARELLKYIDGLVEPVYWHHGRCPSYGDGVAFWALGEMVRMRAGIAETDDNERTRAQLGEALRENVPDPEERSHLEPRLLHLLGVEQRSDTEPEDLFAAWRTLFERIADRGTTVLVFEDVQWADPGLVQFIEHVLEWAGRHPILVVSLARPEVEDRYASLLTGRRTTTLHLRPIGDDAMRNLLETMIPGVSHELIDAVVERAEGVPLYAIETVRMLIDRKFVEPTGTGVLRQVASVAELAVPDTLHSLIASRLDALAAEDRLLLQQAAVLGKAFPMEALSAVSESSATEITERLQGLVRREYLSIDVDPRSPERGQYAFVQSLIREVAYQRLSKRDRRYLHLAAAHHFESLGDESLAVAVATHYLEAHEASADGPDAQALAARARDWLVAAAQRARTLGSYGSALSLVERAMQIPQSDASRVDLWLLACEDASAAGEIDLSEGYARRVIDWSIDAGEADREAAARVALAKVMLRGSVRSDAAIEAIMPLIGENPVSAATVSVEALALLARAHMLRGSEAEAIAWTDRALTAAEQADDAPLVADLLVTRGTALAEFGRWRESIAVLQAGADLAAEVESADTEIRAAINLSYVLCYVDPRRAVDVAKSGFARARHLGLLVDQIVVLNNGAEAAVLVGALDWVESAVAMASTGDLARYPDWYLKQARLQVHIGRGQWEQAEELLRQVIAGGADASLDEKGAMVAAEVRIALGRGRLEAAYNIALAKVRPDMAQNGMSVLVGAAYAAAWMRNADRLRHVLQMLDELGSRGTYLSRVLDGHRAMLALLMSDEGAPMMQIRAVEALRKMGGLFDITLQQISLVRILGDDDRARAAAAEVRDTLERLDAQPYLQRLEEPGVPSSASPST